MAKVHEMLCEICGKPSACVGKYDADSYGPACDSCCGHGNEDGRCIRCTVDDPCDACEREDGSECLALCLLIVPPDENDTPPCRE